MSIWKRLYAKDTSLPHSALSFFTAKTEEGLKLCIDYRALNQVTTKFWYTLLLITVAFELFRWATELIKLYLRSTYNLSEFERGMSWRQPLWPLLILGCVVWSGLALHPRHQNQAAQPKVLWEKSLVRWLLHHLAVTFQKQLLIHYQNSSHLPCILF